MTVGQKNRDNQELNAVVFYVLKCVHKSRVVQYAFITRTTLVLKIWMDRTTYCKLEQQDVEAVATSVWNV